MIMEPRLASQVLEDYHPWLSIYHSHDLGPLQESIAWNTNQREGTGVQPAVCVVSVYPGGRPHLLKDCICFLIGF